MRDALFAAVIGFTVASCTPDRIEEPIDASFLPDGVERAAHHPLIPDGSNFQEARIDPPFWWTEMECDTLQLLVYDRDISGYQVELNKAGLQVLRTVALESPNYLFATIILGDRRYPGAISGTAG